MYYKKSIDKLIIAFTGGGSSGHVTPNLGVIEHFSDKLGSKDYEFFYIGSKNGVERDLVQEFLDNGILSSYFSIRSGKLRRYFSFQNFFDVFNVCVGILQSFYFLIKLRPQVLFSKGGFVSFPVVFSAWILNIPVVAHESDMTMGLTSKLSQPFVKRFCFTFEEALNQCRLVSEKKVLSGTPLRKKVKTSDVSLIHSYFSNRETTLYKSKQNLLIVGGGLGSVLLNLFFECFSDELSSNYNILHVCGTGKTTELVKKSDDYVQKEYIDDFGSALAWADIVVSRSGSNSVYELLAARKVHILVPLSLNASRGEQLSNAAFFVKKGMSMMIEEKDLTKEAVRVLLNEGLIKKNDFINRMKSFKLLDSASIIEDTLRSVIKR
ncbi:UDP-N-acetylglucosamine--N-acetylmuramyl-(pentapeptide) pyrophosphoryl-undecaprenol N-acetylglucosamine transferase [bacterium]|jgi:UDP-N-acetylglucosamine--N-acetylmuramyl-(pentapeptide) pyrophosphoryl-undecaprenol N-acetylglucosamine transferase|nr:UDP-N-acetylglucosamine--N-acetylmuramyl-(pentapeptide) pyrophosphoryl-undecaprenol N-acetylglucosamine transferase [bacterium]